MNTNTILAVLLIALGVAAFAWQGISYTTREKALDLGPVEVTTEKTRTVPVPPIVGVIALAGGVTLLIVNARKA